MMQGWLPQKLRVLRAERGLTLSEAADKAGIGRDTLSYLEQGRREPAIPTLTKIARGYGVPVEELLEEPAVASKAEAPGQTGLTWFELVEQVTEALERAEVDSFIEGAGPRPEQDALYARIAHEGTKVLASGLSSGKYTPDEEGRIGELLARLLRITDRYLNRVDMNTGEASELLEQVEQARARVA